MLEESKIQGVIGQASAAQERIWGSKCSTDWSGATPEQGQCHLGCADSADTCNISISGVCCGRHHRWLFGPNLLLRAASDTEGLPGQNPAGFGISPAIFGSSTTYLAKLFWCLFTFAVQKFKGLSCIPTCPLPLILSMDTTGKSRDLLYSVPSLMKMLNTFGIVFKSKKKAPDNLHLINICENSRYVLR